MSRSLRLAAPIAVAFAVAAPLAPVHAGDGASITVTGPTRHPSGEPANGVHQRTRLTSDVSVSYADLDLRSDYGRWVLVQRLRIAADAACDQIDAIDPPSGAGGMTADAGNCRHMAMKRAEPEMRRAILASG